MLKSLLVTLLMIVSLTLSSCSTGISSLQPYVNSAKGYEFFYPNGWIQVDVKNASVGVDVVFHDLIERSENLSVIISEVPEDKDLTDLGTPSEVGYRFLKQLNNDNNSDREVELLNAESRESNDKTYYTLEYRVKLPDSSVRHDIASVAVNRGKLYTLNFSTAEKRWNKVKSLFRTAVDSFVINY
jgi:photosystem II oxygen-evolving enhancer protein 2